ncbi:hypothetical protein ABW19_dt0200012 [Dactylella cylindrospora]|nr:hypothetical protein ABW19_dt0200012 [Dactylella cylindrospora]
MATSTRDEGAAVAGQFRDYFSTLPTELLLDILNHFDKFQLISTISRISSRFYKLIQNLHPTILGLTPQIWTEILGHLDSKNLLLVTGVCRTLRKLVYNSTDSQLTTLAYSPYLPEPRTNWKKVKPENVEVHPIFWRLVIYLHHKEIGAKIDSLYASQSWSYSAEGHSIALRAATNPPTRKVILRFPIPEFKDEITETILPYDYKGEASPKQLEQPGDTNVVTVGDVIRGLRRLARLPPTEKQMRDLEPLEPGSSAARCKRRPPKAQYDITPFGRAYENLKAVEITEDGVVTLEVMLTPLRLR